MTNEQEEVRKKLLAVCMSHHLCRKCRQGYRPRFRDARRLPCSNPRCEPEKLERHGDVYTLPIPGRRMRSYVAQYLRPGPPIATARFRRRAFVLGSTVVSPGPDESNNGVLWTWERT